MVSRSSPVLLWVNCAGSSANSIRTSGAGTAQLFHRTTVLRVTERIEHPIGRENVHLSADRPERRLTRRFERPSAVPDLPAGRSVERIQDGWSRPHPLIHRKYHVVD